MEEIKNHCKNIRKKIIETGYKKGFAHFGGSLSLVEILTILYKKYLKYDLKNPTKEDRDRVILSKGHCALGFYCTLQEFEILTEEELNSFCQNDGDFPTHIVRNLEKGIELSSGSLGMGLSFATGVAISLKEKKLSNKIYVITGNGELNEGSNWESIMFVGANKMNNITLIIDSNKLQGDGYSSKVLLMPNLKENICSFGWEVVEIDGHNEDEIRKALEIKSDKPLAIISNTVKGKGVSFMENEGIWHHYKMSEEQYECALNDLEAKC